MYVKKVNVQGRREESHIPAYFHPQACHVRECSLELREVHEPEIGGDGDVVTSNESAHRAVQIVCGLCSMRRCLSRPSSRGYLRHWRRIYWRCPAPAAVHTVTIGRLGSR